ncbi:glycosyltransferase family 2 protein [Psychrobacter sp. Arc29]|uniref:glycosyltransferase family 2 protein n=1 Tax=Psychrobacter sp. Arc29 TaxID=3046690 RepID=UPI00352C2C2E
MDRSKIGLVIPAYNEANTIFDVVKAASKYGRPIVVNDCSNDSTAELALKAGATVVNHTVNLGYDGALNSGFARAHKIGCEVIITLDADGQHNPKLIKSFIDALENGSDMVLGIRSNKPRFSEHLFALATNKKFGIKDPLCGMKGYSAKVYEALGYFDSYESIGTELMLFAASNNFLFTQIFFNVEERQDRPRFGGALRSNLKILKAMSLSM